MCVYSPRSTLPAHPPPWERHIQHLILYIYLPIYLFYRTYILPRTYIPTLYLSICLYLFPLIFFILSTTWKIGLLFLGIDVCAWWVCLCERVSMPDWNLSNNIRTDISSHSSSVKGGRAKQRETLRKKKEPPHTNTDPLSLYINIYIYMYLYLCVFKCDVIRPPRDTHSSTGMKALDLTFYLPESDGVSVVPYTNSIYILCACACVQIPSGNAVCFRNFLLCARHKEWNIWVCVEGWRETEGEREREREREGP